MLPKTLRRTGAAIAAALAIAFVPVRGAARAPRLVVLLVVDQFRGDYVEKF